MPAVLKRFVISLYKLMSLEELDMLKYGPSSYEIIWPISQIHNYE